MRRTVAVIAAIMILATCIAVVPRASAESWTDDFTNTGMQFDPRWETGGSGQVLPFNGTFAEPVVFTTTETSGWHGPWLRAQVAPSADFNISLKLDCVADFTKETIGRLELRLLDTSGAQIYSISWNDTALTDNKAYFSLKGRTDSVLLYKNTDGYLYSIFRGKTVSIERLSGTLNLFIDGKMVYSDEASSKALGYVKIEFLKHELSCTPTYMRADMITVSTVPAAAPSPPQSLQCVPGDSSNALEWSNPDNTGGLPISGFSIYRGAVSGSLQYLTSVGIVNHYTDPGLVNGQAYYYAVTAINDLGQSVPSAECLGIPKGLPGQPRNLQGIAGPDYVNLTWQAPLSDGGSPITGYRLYRDGSLVQASISLTVFTDPGLAVGIEYYYTVSAVNSIGEGFNSSEITATPGSSQHLPTAPRDMRAAEGDGIVSLSWSPPSSTGNSFIVNYTVYRGTAPGTATQLAVLGAVIGFVDTGLSNGQTYYYSVTATNLVGESPASSEISATPTAPAPPSAPMLLTAAPGVDRASLNWTMPLSNGGSEITGYFVYRGNSSGQLIKVATLGPVGEFTDTDLLGGRSYYYAVSAANAAGEGPQCPEVMVTPTAPQGNATIPDAPEEIGGITMTSSLFTAAILGIAILAMVLYFRKPDKKKEPPTP